MNFLEELKWREMISDITPETEKYLNAKMAKGYVGFDPTADSLGVGNLVQIMTLLLFQKSGHKPFVLLGGATGMIGDPSGKNQERNLLDKDVLKHNQECQLTQFKKFLDFDCRKENSAEILNNYDWFNKIKKIDFIRDTGKHISVNNMLSKDSVKNRIDNGISFTEFCYQLMQGYDFCHLNKKFGISLQMGGSDQWGNITTGIELARKKNQGELHGLTTSLLKKSDGAKFGKTENGNIWLDPKKTSVYNFFQFWFNLSDEDAKKFIKIFTLKSKTEIENLIEQHQKAPSLRLLQNTLAEDITIRVHSKEELKKVKTANELLFNKVDLEIIDQQTLNDTFEIMPFCDVDNFNEMNILDFLVLSKTCLSKTEAKKLIEQNGLKINKRKINDTKKLIGNEFLIHEKWIFVQKGKKDNHIVRINRKK